MQNSTSRFWTALTKINHKSIQENGIDDEAKAAVPFTVHEQIAKAMLRQGDIVSWTYLILQWKLISRKCNNAETLKTKLEEERGPRNSGRNRRKILWNNLNATSFLKFFDDSKRGYLKELQVTETNCQDSDMKAKQIYGPIKSLGMPTIQVR